MSRLLSKLRGGTPLADVDDDTLIAKWQAGDEAAFDAIVARYGSAVQGFLVRMLGDEQLAQDAFADTFLRLVRAPQKYRPQSGGSFRAWLFSIARRCALDTNRTRNRVTRLSLRLIQSGWDLKSASAQSERRLLREERARILDSLLNELSDEQRAALLLYYRYDLDTREVAEVLGLEEQQVRDRIAYGRRKLKDAMGRVSIRTSP